jgi:hypothetical protein
MSAVIRMKTEKFGFHLPLVSIAWSASPRSPLAPRRHIVLSDGADA